MSFERKILIGILLVFFFSCNIEKRKYRPGFYVPDRTAVSFRAHSDFNLEKDSVQVPVLQVPNDPVVALSVSTNHELQSDPKTPISISSNKTVQIPIHTERKFLGPKSLSVKSPTTHWNDDVSDALFLTGMAIFFVGVILLVIGALTLPANAAVATPLMFMGLLFLCAGTIFAGIGDPSILLDVLLDILAAL